MNKCCCFSRTLQSNQTQKDNDEKETGDFSRYSILLTGYNSNLEIPWENLNIDFSGEMLSGVFTVYLKGKLISTSRNVMVKTLKPNSAITYFKGLVREIKIMSSILPHENIIQIIGAVTIHLGEIFIVMEYCDLGTLEGYLRKHKGRFVEKLLRSENEVPFRSFQTVTNFNAKNSRPRSTAPMGWLNSIDLLSWAIDIANGMDYLHTNRLLHWELAARSVFLSANGIAKLGDFHSLRRLDQGKKFIILSESDCLLPWKWMAVESLYTCRFSFDTDIWTYGIALWEIFSLGGDPYIKAQLNPEFLQELSQGRRPPKPVHSTDQIYSVMQRCWSAEPVKRPRFQDIAAELSQIRYKACVHNASRLQSC